MKQLISFGATVFAFACLGVFAGSVFGIPRLPMPTTAVVHAQNPPGGGYWCGLQIAGETANRYVYGSVNEECGSCSGHTAPFGNWGVESIYGPKWDGAQYRGWAFWNANCAESMDDPEWNSCTSSFAGSFYLNDPSGSPTQQFSADTTYLGYVWDWFGTTEENGCSVLHESSLGGGGVLEIYELDPFGGDDHVTNLSVGSNLVQLSCTVDGCTPTSAAFSTSANGVTSADFRVSLWGSCRYIDGKGCL